MHCAWSWIYPRPVTSRRKILRVVHEEKFIHYNGWLNGVKKLGTKLSVFMVEGDESALWQIRVRLIVLISQPCLLKTFYFKDEV